MVPLHTTLPWWVMKRPVQLRQHRSVSYAAKCSRNAGHLALMWTGGAAVNIGKPCHKGNGADAPCTRQPPSRRFAVSVLRRGRADHKARATTQDCTAPHAVNMTHHHLLGQVPIGQWAIHPCHDDNEDVIRITQD